MALDRIAIHNTVFPETALQVIGFGRTEQGDFAVLVRQPFILINDEVISDDETIAFMKEIGFEETAGPGGNIGSVHSEFSNSDYYIADLHKENIVRYVDQYGMPFYFVIDCMAYYNTPGLCLGGTYSVGTPEEWAYKSEDDWPYSLSPSDSPLHYL